MNNNKMAAYLLRFGIAFVMVYASVEMYMHPENFFKYIPKVILKTIPFKHFLDLLGVSEIILGVWLLTGWKGHWASLLSVLMMAGIVACNMEHFNILFRNVAIAFGGLALIACELEIQKEVSVAKSKGC